MSKERNKILNKAKKLKELSERGIGGERENAKIMLEKYMLKHNILEKELNIYNESDTFSYKHMTDEQFLQMIIIELIPVGIASLFSRFGNDEDKAKANSSANIFMNKFINIILERTISKK